MREAGGLEPERSKGAVARAALRFLPCCPGSVGQSGGFPAGPAVRSVDLARV